MGSSGFDSVLIIGGGAMAIDHHVPRLRRILHCARIEIFEIDELRRTQLKGRFKQNGRVSIVDHLPKVGFYQLVVIATPPKFHLQYFKSLLDHSDQFLIEKPMAIDYKEAKELQDIARSANKKVYVNMIRRTLRSYGLIKEIVASGEFGNLRKVCVFEGSVFGWKAVSAGSFSRSLNGGGVLMDTGPHTLDLLFQVFNELHLVDCRVDGRAPAIEANCYLSLQANGDVPVGVSLSRNRYLSNTACFEFESATLEVGVTGEFVKITRHSGENYQIIAEGIKSEPTWPTLVDQFYEDFLGNQDNRRVGPNQSLAIARITEEAYIKAVFVEAAF